jgi:hypothetical protein
MFGSKGFYFRETVLFETIIEATNTIDNDADIAARFH